MARDVDIGFPTTESMNVLARGTLTTSSATVPADTGRTEANDFWNGCYLHILGGALKGQVKAITDFALTGGVITCTLTSAPGLVPYEILAP
jgi:hypothetical protein